MQKAECSCLLYSGSSYKAASQECLILRKDTYQDCLVTWKCVERTNERTTLQTQSLEFQTQMIFPSVRFGCKVITLDGNGRFLIPKRYLKLAKIQQDVRFIGLDDTIEIWSKEIADKPFITGGPGKELEEMGTNNNVEIEWVKQNRYIMYRWLINESVDGMNIQPGGIYVDATFRRRRTFKENSKPAG